MNKRRIGVRAIIYKDGQILGVKHKTKEGAPKNWWAVPGGGLDPSESLEDGLKREMMEELGIAITPGRLLFIQQFKSSRGDCDEELEFYFLVENSDDFAAIDFSTTSHGLTELAACEFIDPKVESMRPGFLGEVDIKSHIESVQPVYIANRFIE